jgi:hypothetical protein
MSNGSTLVRNRRHLWPTGESDIPKSPHTKSHRWCGAVSINKCSRQLNTCCAFST